MKDETGKVYFDADEQAEIDKAVEEKVNKGIGDRLSREGYFDMKDIVESLKTGFGYTGTTAEIKATIKKEADDFVKQLEDGQKKETLDALKEQAKETGTTPELLATIKALQDDMSEIKGKNKAAEDAINQRVAAQKMQDEQLKYFSECEDTKDIDLKLLNNDQKFVKFLSKQKQTWTKEWLVDAWKDYVELVGGAEADAIAKMQANLDRSSSNGRNSSADGAGALTADEKSFVDDHNRRYPNMKMTYKEFSERKRR